MSLFQELNSILYQRVLQNQMLAPYTTFKIGGTARYFFVAKITDEIVVAVHAATQCGVPFFILGGGSNLWVSDCGFYGLVIKCENKEICFKDDRITVDAGVTWGVLTVKAHENGLVGLSELTHIPGTIGGAVRGNAGSMGKETKDVVARVLVLKTSAITSSYLREGDSVCENPEWINNIECNFCYRESIFKHNKWVILKAELQLHCGDVEESKQKVKKYLEKRRVSQPLNKPCAGCFFKNPHGMNASKLIDESGLKGMFIGQARISPIHANFIENLGGAKSSDLLQLVNTVKKKVYEKFGVWLQEEVVRVGFEE